MKEIKNLINNSVKIKIQKNLAKKNSKFDFLGKKILFISDQKIWLKNKSFFNDNFLSNFWAKILLKNPKANIENIDVIKNFFIKNNCDAIVALGSGTINDLAKYLAANLEIKYAIFTSAASMNGYLSINSSIEINGHKKTFYSTLPAAIYCDLEIIKNSPSKMIKAGIGDSLCFYSCWFDWLFSNLVIDSKFDEKCFLILKDRIDFLIKNYQNFKIRDEKLIKILIEILLISGYSMTIAKGSYPASQSEHLMAHCLNMKFPQLEKKLLHGEMIAISTIQAMEKQAKLMKKIINNSELKIEIDEKKAKKKLTDYFGLELGESCFQEYHQKIKKIKNSSFIKKISEEKYLIKIAKNNQIKLQKTLINPSKITKIFDHFNIKYSIAENFVSKKDFLESLKMAKYIRDRFTCLDID